MINNKTVNLVFAIIAGLLAYALIGKMGLYILQVSWGDYAVHSKDKSYTLQMLLSRLFIGLLASIIAGIATAKIANGNGKCACVVGLTVLCSASYVHFFLVWSDYPLWYHLAYLLTIIPVTVLGHYFISRNRVDELDRR